MNINIGPIKLQNKIGPVNYKNIDPFIDSRKKLRNNRPCINI
jgi:hypothetical protein